jgi:hypothetical protein
MSVERRDLLRLGARLKLDVAASEVVEALRERDVPVIVLKGSALAERLYGPDSLRSHDDVDLLVRGEDIRDAGEGLAELGFRMADEEDYAQAWIRAADGVTVDLHTTLVGVGVSAQEAWNLLARETTEARLGRTRLSVFDDAALALHVALHAAQHGPRGGKGIEDLRRAVDELDESAWRAAAGLAEQLDATAAFAAGLRLVPAGADLAGELGLSSARPAAVALRAASPPPTALGLQRLLQAQGFGAKAKLLARELAPSPAFMRAVYPVARRGSLGLVTSYAWRPFWLLWHAGPALRAWRRAQRPGG